MPESASETTIELVYKLMISAHAGRRYARRWIWCLDAGEQQRFHTTTHMLERLRRAGPG